MQHCTRVRLPTIKVATHVPEKMFDFEEKKEGQSKKEAQPSGVKRRKQDPCAAVGPGMGRIENSGFTTNMMERDIHEQKRYARRRNLASAPSCLQASQSASAEAKARGASRRTGPYHFEPIVNETTESRRTRCSERHDVWHTPKPQRGPYIFISDTTIVSCTERLAVWHTPKPRRVADDDG